MSMHRTISALALIACTVAAFAQQTPPPPPAQVLPTVITFQEKTVKNATMAPTALDQQVQRTKTIPSANDQ